MAKIGRSAEAGKLMRRNRMKSNFVSSGTIRTSGMEGCRRTFTADFVRLYPRHARERSQACADCVNLSAAAAHPRLARGGQGVDGRDQPGHDALWFDSVQTCTGSYEIASCRGRDHLTHHAT